MNAASRRGGALLGAAIVVVAGAVVGWNATRFTDAQMHVRAKDLSFLPTPAMAKALAAGHGATIAKLRWIDSAAYFQYQLDRRDDTVKDDGRGDGRGGFERLYETLIALDPRFLPFYEHAFLATDALAARPQAALGLIGRGVLELPHETSLRRLWAVQLVTRFDWERRQPQAFQGMLDGWLDAEETEGGKRMVLDWSRGLAIRRFQGLEALPWWREQLRGAQPGSPNAQFAERTLRELLGRWYEGQLARLAEAHQRVRGVPAPSLDALCDDAVVRSAWPAGPPPYAPVARVPGGWTLRADPWGYAPVWHAGSGLSPGLRRLFAERGQAAMAAAFAALPSGERVSVERAQAAGVQLGWPGAWRLAPDGTLQPADSPPEQQPWDLR